MYLAPKNIKLNAGTQFVVLDKNEPLRSNDVVRHTVYVSDYIDSHAEGNMNWQLVKDCLPGWVGKNITELEQFSSIKSRFEIIRIIK